MWVAISLALTFFAVAGAVSDARTERISNRLVVAGILIALLLRAGLGWEGVYHGITAGLIVLAAGLPLFALRAFGGGDVKFMVMCAIFVGLPLLGRATLWSAAAGGLLAVFVIAKRKLPLVAATRVGDLLRLAFTFGRSGERLTLDDKGAIAAPFGVAIAMGCLLVWFGTAGGWIP